jgi:hypothetical protein
MRNLSQGSRRRFREEKAVIKLPAALMVVAMIIVIIGVDFAFFRDRFWQRLMTNVIIVIAFGVIYFVFIRRS